MGIVLRLFANSKTVTSYDASIFRIGPTEMPLNRRRFQFSLRTMLFVTVLFTSLFAAIGNHFYRERQHKAAMYDIAEKGGTTLIFNEDMSVVVFRNAPSCYSIQDLTEFHCAHRRQIIFSDSDFRDLARIKNLVLLDLEGTQVTDQSLDSIAKLDNLRVLCVQNTRLTSNGIAKLKDARPALHIAATDWWHCQDVGQVIWSNASSAKGT